MRRQGGFTLIELIMVIVLLSIVATVSVQFVAQSTQGAIDTSARQQRALTGVVISEQITRALREALPQSVRTMGNCIEWMPILAASNYLDLPLSEAENSFAIVPIGSGATNGRIVVYPYSGDLYDPSVPSPGPLSPTASVSGSNVTFDDSATHRFSEDSPRKRFFLVGPPRALCPSSGGNFLHRYAGYGIQSTTPASPSDTQVLAANIEPGSVSFNVQQATLQRGAVVSFAFTLEDPQSDETLSVSQEVQIRNVP